MSYETGRAAAARELAAHLAVARAHYGIPLGATRETAPAPSLYALHLAEVRRLYGEDQPIATIAQQLGLPPSTVTNLISRARRLGDWPPELQRRRGQPALA